jgi:hypothetical protein
MLSSLTNIEKDRQEQRPPSVVAAKSSGEAILDLMIVGE